MDGIYSKIEFFFFYFFSSSQIKIKSMLYLKNKYTHNLLILYNVILVGKSHEVALMLYAVFGAEEKRPK